MHQPKQSKNRSENLTFEKLHGEILTQSWKHLCKKIVLSTLTWRSLDFPNGCFSVKNYYNNFFEYSKYVSPFLGPDRPQIIIHAYFTWCSHSVCCYYCHLLRSYQLRCPFIWIAWRMALKVWWLMNQVIYKRICFESLWILNWKKNIFRATINVDSTECLWNCGNDSFYSLCIQSMRNCWKRKFKLEYSQVITFLSRF